MQHRSETPMSGKVRLEESPQERLLVVACQIPTPGDRLLYFRIYLVCIGMYIYLSLFIYIIFSGLERSANSLVL